MVVEIKMPVRVAKVSGPSSEKKNTPCRQSLQLVIVLFLLATVAVSASKLVATFATRFPSLIRWPESPSNMVSRLLTSRGLVTDLQMFALPSLRIPLPGRHPPSYSISEHDISLRPRCTSTSVEVSPTKGYLRHDQFAQFLWTKSASGGTEFGGYKMSKSNEKSRTTGNGYWIEKGLTSGDLLLLDPRDGETEGCADSYRRRWLKSENDVGWETPEKVITEENDGSSHSRSSSITGKRLALRPKSAGRVTLASDESGWLSSSSSSEYSPTADAPSKVHKSFSLSNMLDQDLSSFTSFWSNTKWRLKPDFQSGSTSTLTNPLLEGLPNLTRRIKTALD